MHATNAQAVDDNPEIEVTFTDNVSGDGGTEFKADWIEVTNGGANVLYANPYASIDGGATGVVIPAGKTFRFEWAPENQAARDKGGFSSLFLLGTAAGTTAYVNAGAD
jgi:hypothetical protein